jgi:hypothetical protein
MQIKVTSVGPVSQKESKAGKSYSVFSLSYEEDGEAKKQFLNSYGKAVYATFRDSTPGDLFEVTTEQKGEFTNWVSATKVGSEAASTAKPKVDDKMTKEDWAMKDIRITRSACVKAASNIADTAEDAIAIAKQFEAYIYNQPVFETEGIHENGVM